MAYSTISKSTDFFSPRIYTGNGSAGHAITGVGHQPDFTWIKNRSATDGHHLYDAVRGVTKRLRSDTDATEATTPNGLTSFNSGGFTVGTEEDVNTNNENFASWNWKAGTGQGSSNTDGSINTTYTSVNTTSGFSISAYTGAGSTSTVGHGLGVAPKVIIIKSRSNAGNWQFYHEDMGNGKKLILNTNSAEISSGYMNSTSPTNQVFTVINDADVGTNGYTYVAYCFTPITGFSAMGSYTGNGEPGNDAPFIYTGFKPAMVLIKSSTYADSWFFNDNTRSATGGTNPNSYYIRPNTNEAEGTSTSLTMDLLSNGFKLQNNDNAYNKNTQTYIYMAFGQTLTGSNNVPCTAR